MTGALSELKILEWGSFISAPLSARLLADLGAEVIKIEKPSEGDEARLCGPFPGDIPHPEKSGLFLYTNFNKRGVTLDPTVPEGRKILDQLLGWADVFISNQPYRILELNKIDYENLKKAFPGLIMTNITPYGTSGPYRDWKGYDLNAGALGGITSTIGYPDRTPLNPPLNQSEHQAGLISAISTMLALFKRDVDGKGSHVDISVADCWATIHIGMGTQNYLEEGRVRRRSGHMVPHYPYPDTVLPCKNGSVCIDTPQNRQWRRFLEVMGNPDWANDPIFADRIKTADEYWKQADSYLESWLKKHEKDEIFSACQKARVPCAPIRTVDEVVSEEQIKERNFFSGIEGPAAGLLKYPGVCYQFSETPFKISRPAPLLGEHNSEIYGQLFGYCPEDLERLKNGGII